MLHNGEHLKVYDAYFGLSGKADARICEVLGTYRAEVAHIDASGMGGRESSNVIENLMALHPEVHRVTEGRSEWKEWLKEQHQIFMETRVPVYQRVPLDPVYCEIFMMTYKHLSRRYDY